MSRTLPFHPCKYCGISECHEECKERENKLFESIKKVTFISDANTEVIKAILRWDIRPSSVINKIRTIQTGE